VLLAGDENRVKADRMVLRYVEGHNGLLPKDAGALLTAAALAIRGRYGYPSTLTARHLDSAIWNVAREWGRRAKEGPVGLHPAVASWAAAAPFKPSILKSHWRGRPKP
jgi:hypothetical protein